ncbi:MAG: hydrophobe/amphiphile efflux family transporter [Burkholderiales bacterium]|jgi:hydrophobe/amphiphile efflux-1 (HAE1) family protein|nr:hydrophobe/amphiphile efflux family transporter [Burkholderiales bacterium]
MQHSLFIRRPILASVISIIITLCGLVAIFNLPVSQFPNITPPTISISASYPGANAETAAKVVAAQIEGQMNGVSNLIYMTTSASSTGSVSIQLTFEVGTNLNYTINEVLNRLQAAMPLLPNVVQKMGVTTRKSSPDMLLNISFYSEPYLDPKFVTNYLQRTVENDLLLLPTVGTVNVFGTGAYAIRIWLDPNKMRRYGIAVTDIQNAIKDQNQEYIVGRTNSVPDSSNFIALNILGQQMYSDPKQFANIIIRNNNNQTIKIKDIAKVELGSTNYNTLALVNFRDEKGKFKSYPCSIMQIFLIPGANQLEAKRQILDKLEKDSKSFPNGLKYKVTIDNSRFVAASVHNVIITLEFSFVLVALVIFVFLRNFRASLIAICTIPVSVIGTFACLYLAGFSLNTLSLFALILAIGIVVDDAIVIVENIERIRSEHPEYGMRQVIETTMHEVFGAIVAIVLVLSVVFIPVMGLSGLAGIMYRQFAVTIACAVVLSGICALTFTPAISYLMLRHVPHKKESKTHWFDRGFDRLTHWYLRCAAFLLDHKKIALAVWFFIIFAMIGVFKLVPLGFVPGEDQGLLFTTINLPSSSSLQATTKIADKMIDDLTKNPNIASVTTIIGYDFLDSGNVKTYAASYFIALTDWDKRHGKDSDANSIIAKLNKIGAGSSSITVRAFNQPPIRGLSTTGGVEFYVEDRVVGNPHKLQEICDDLIARLIKHKEVATAFQTLDTNVLQMSVLPDIDRAKYYGVNLQQLYNSVESIYGNNNVNYAYIMQDLVWVILEGDYSYRKSIDQLRNIFLQSTTSKDLVPVATLVKTNNSRDAQVVQRFNNYVASKVVAVPAPGHSAGEVMNIIDQEMLQLPKGYYYDWFGTSYQQKKSQKTSGLAFIFSLVMIYLVLAALYELWRLPLVVIMGVPFALFGAGVILLLSGKPNDLYFQISLIALLGLSAKNIILLVEFALQSYRAGHSAKNSVLHALKLRFRPIVMTSVTFIMGTIPLVFAEGAGANAQHSLGLGIIGGILGSIFLATMLIPSYFVIVMKKRNRYKDK